MTSVGLYSEQTDLKMNYLPPLNFIRRNNYNQHSVFTLTFEPFTVYTANNNNDLFHYLQYSFYLAVHNERFI